MIPGRRLVLSISILVLFLLPVWALGATTWTVCSSGCNFTTLMAANSGAADGDTINVTDSRTYTEAGGIFGAFEPSKALTWNLGSATVTSKTYTPAVMRPTTKVMTFNGGIFDGQGTRSSILYSGVAANLAFVGSTFIATTNNMFVASSSTLAFTDCTFNNTAGTIFFNGSPSLTVTRPTINHSGTYIIDSTPDGNAFTMVGPGTINVGASVTASPFWFGGASTASISGQNITINNTAFANPVISMTAATGKTATYTMSENMIVNNSTIAAGSTPIVSATSGGGTINLTVQDEIYTSLAKSGALIVVGTEGATLDPNHDKITAVIQRNKLYGENASSLTNNSPGVHAILIAYQKGVTVTGNYVKGSGYGTVLKHMVSAGGTQGYCTYNVYDQCRWGIYNKGYPQVLIANNTGYASYVFTNTDSNGPPYGIRVDRNTGTATENVTIYNNVFSLATGNSLIDYGLYVSEGSYTAAQWYANGLREDNNLVYFAPGTTGQFGYINGVGYNTQSDWNTNYSNFGAHDNNGNPLFLDGPNGNFRLASSSPAIGAGTSLCSALVSAVDLAGKTVCQGGVYVGGGAAPSIGAYNYKSGMARMWKMIQNQQ